ncbi:very-long-chain (3R)-3-hydroxyacyl-CoA dehydratase 2 isoform X2 [Leopardus geoffroyi]|uniref:very-long-chain (3R)-3-hydroxyacyl-CoA dehydratase 2 isoform X2 n=1 Tax=Leopardus geoffroyi TaxID=46844 RepID=UPI001E25EE0D|nr:very-long-chain (3R)-3-hydroxyacyl-CoA dehydratase 2 isoform X2 [Leopardus geoffroyi]
MAAAAATAATKGNGGGGGRAGAGEAGGARKKKGPGPLATAYLVIYNVVMTAGWLVIAVGLVRAYLAKGSYHSLYYSIEKPLKFFQTGALLEILHCAVGIVPSSVVLTSFQVMSRVFLIWAVTHSVKELEFLCKLPWLNYTSLPHPSASTLAIEQGTETCRLQHGGSGTQLTDCTGQRKASRLAEPPHSHSHLCHDCKCATLKHGFWTFLATNALSPAFPL